MLVPIREKKARRKLAAAAAAATAVLVEGWTLSVFPSDSLWPAAVAAAMVIPALLVYRLTDHVLVTATCAPARYAALFGTIPAAMTSLLLAPAIGLIAVGWFFTVIGWLILLLAAPATFFAYRATQATARGRYWAGPTAWLPTEAAALATVAGYEPFSHGVLLAGMLLFLAVCAAANLAAGYGALATGLPRN